MKKFVAAIITSFALVSSLQAIPSNLGESINEYEAILNSSLLQTSLEQSEFIIDLKRLTKALTATTVYYEIRTYSPTAPVTAGETESHEKSQKHPRKHHHNEKRYSVEITLSENPQIGPPIIDVVSIVPTSKRVIVEEIEEIN
jgi:hypothetical protein